jgi:chlorophyllide a reductase subunit X
MSVTLLTHRSLRAEAAVEPDPVHTGEVTKTTQIIAIYGKGGSGKSFALSNLSYMMAQQGKRVLLIGCDPKSDTTSLLFGGKSCPTIIATSAAKKLAGEEVRIEDVCFQRDGVFAMELGGPEVGRGCGGRGIIHGFELLEKLGFHDWDFDYVLLDFLGDVVCGGFGLPIARDMCQKVIVVGSNDLQSLYVANNVCSRSNTSARWAATSASPAWSSTRTTAPARLKPLPRRSASRCWRPSPPTRTSAASPPTIRSSAPPTASGVRSSPASPRRWRLSASTPRPLTQDGLLGLFDPDSTGAGVTLTPPPRRTSAASPSSPKRRSKSSTTRRSDVFDGP